MPRQTSEAFSRVLIDAALCESKWDIRDMSQVSFEMLGTSGRADYVLKGKNGPLCVIEAKRKDIDPYDAKTQAQGYAENLKAPFIILSNGVIHYFWNLARGDQDAYRIERLPSLADLERLRLKNQQPPRPLLTEVMTPGYLTKIDPNIKLRGYQVRALDAIADEFDHQHKRKFLMEMATGTGKTLLCAALIRRFLETRNAERVLFIVDRIELAKQTKETFDVVLSDFKPVIFKTARRKPMELLGSSVVIATIQSLQVDRRYREEFTPYHFDLVVNDEAHRSIYGDAREVVQYFQATRVGLTATPKAYLKNVNVNQLAEENPKALEARQLRDTYHYFGCVPGEPTFRYDISDAVKDPDGPFLVLPKIWDIRSDITTQALEEAGWTVTINEEEETFKVNQLERKVFIPERNRLICEQFIKNAMRDPEGKIGRTILFAVNQRHATELTKILNALQPNLAITITSRIKDASTIAKDFRDGRRQERVAVSVDMLSTGYNCMDILNIVLARPIFSPSEYIQIKGRGTRLFTFQHDGKTFKKENFFVLDFCGVAEYFQETYDYTEPLTVPREPDKAKGKRGNMVRDENEPITYDGTVKPPPPKTIPVWQGTDIVKTTEMKIVGPDGEKVDVMTFRGAYERDIKEFYAKNVDFRQAVDEEDDDKIVTIMDERFFNQPTMFYTPGKLIKSYGVPAPVPTFVFGALEKRPIPTKERIVEDTVQSIAARYNLRFNDQRILSTLAQLVAEDQNACKQFIEDDPRVFERAQFAPLGGIEAVVNFAEHDDAFSALRDTFLVRQNQLAD